MTGLNLAESGRSNSSRRDMRSSLSSAVARRTRRCADARGEVQGEEPPGDVTALKQTRRGRSLASKDWRPTSCRLLERVTTYSRPSKWSSHQIGSGTTKAHHSVRRRHRGRSSSSGRPVRVTSRADANGLQAGLAVPMRQNSRLARATLPRPVVTSLSDVRTSRRSIHTFSSCHVPTQRIPLKGPYTHPECFSLFSMR